MAKVYVSSTIVDLRQERQAVLEWLRGARHQAVDSYLPDSDTVRDSCLEDVGTCDLYVLILGHRYGFQPPDENPEGLSITQLEFRWAGECGIPRIALVRTSIPDVSLSDLGDPPRLALVSAFRAEVAREVRAAEFSDLQGLVQGLSTGVLAALEKLGKRPDGSRAGGPVLRLPPRLPMLAGREELLGELDSRLAGFEGSGPRVVALCGLGGAGKTSVAVEYAHRHLGEVGVAWQLAAEDPTLLAAGFGELAAQLGVKDLADTRDPVVSAHGALTGYPAGWLLVFDNAPDRASVQAFLPPAGHGRILVTSRDPVWPLDQMLDVPVLGQEVAADFLRDRTGDADRQATLELAGELGGLPLALEQAAAYTQATGDTLAGYLALFQQRRLDMLARGKATGYESTVAATWSLAFGELEQSAPQAAGLLRLLACCAPEAIPLRLLLRPRPGLAEQLPAGVAPVLVPLLADELAARDAIAALRRYSLVKPAGDGSVSVHRLVQAVTAALMPAGLAAQWAQAAAALIEAAIPADTGPPDTWPVCAALLPHAQFALTDDSNGMFRLANYLGERGSYAAALALQQRVLDSQERSLGPEHPDTLRSRRELAYWTGRAGDSAAARDQVAALLPAHVRILGAEHPDTLDARHSLAYWTGEAGDPAAARDQYAALLPICERVFGAEHPDTLDARHSFARWTGAAGDPSAARDQYAALLPIRVRVLGAEHRDTLRTQHNLAHWTGRAGDPAAARDQVAALLPVRERILGAEHPNTLASRDSLAHWTGEAGDPAAARDQYAALLPICERVLGAEHPDTLDTRHSLARWTGAAGDPAPAREQIAALLPDLERVRGPEHPDTLGARTSLAVWTGVAGDAAGARDQFAALLPIRERVSGAEHPATLTTRANLAHWTREADPGSGSGMD